MNNTPYVGKTQIKTGVRLLLLNPIAPFGNDEGPFRFEKQEFLSETTAVDEIYCSGAPLSVENAVDKKSAVPFVVEKACWAESQGYDLVIINCMLDPGLEEARSSVSIPVIGLREASTAVALMLGTNPGYIYPDNIAVRNLGDNEATTYEELLTSGRNRIVNQGTDVLIPNCALVGGLAGRLQAELGVPVLPNRDVALRIGELVASLQLKPEAAWVAGTRSRAKILLTKIYQLPVVGGLVYRIVSVLKTILR